MVGAEGGGGCPALVAGSRLDCLFLAGRPRLSLHQARAVAEGVAAGKREGLLVLRALLRGAAGERLRPGHLRRAEAVTCGVGTRTPKM